MNTLLFEYSVTIQIFEYHFEYLNIRKDITLGVLHMKILDLTYSSQSDQSILNLYCIKEAYIRTII